MNPHAALLRHLECAADSFGADLPLRVPREAAEPQTAPPDTMPANAEPAARTQAARAPAKPEPVTATAPPAALDANDPAGCPDLGVLGTLAAACTRCKLSQKRQQVVFGEGHPDADVMFVGEAPGAQEDRQGRPFVGPAGPLRTKIIENAMGLSRDAVYIANVAKCRPPGNRNPEPDEVAACRPYLERQIALIQPRVLVLMGRVAATALLGTTQPMRALRGAELEFHGVPVVATWHPAYLLRQPSAKAETWEDIKRVNRLLGRPAVPPTR